MDALMQDLRHAVRALLRAPGFTLVALLTLALGIGANAAIFSVVYAVLLRPLPFPAADRIVRAYQTTENQLSTVSPSDFADWKNGLRSVSALAAYGEGSWALTGDGPAEQIPGGAVTFDFFRVFGVAPALGRGFAPEELEPGHERVVVLGDGLWRRRFGADPAVVGRTIMLDGSPARVIGVMPRTFDYPRGAQMWLTLRFTADDLATQRGAHYLDVVGRLASGISLDGANAELAALAERIGRQYPNQNIGYSARSVAFREAEVGEARGPLVLLLGAVGLVLLIACVNVANLLLARASGRARDAAVRTALGASRRRVAQGVLTESGVLGLGGAALGLVFAVWITEAITALAPRNVPGLDTAGVNLPVLAFTLGVGLLTALLFGLLPAWRTATVVGLAQRLRDGGAALGQRHGRRTRASLVTAEVALAVMLVIGAGLLLKSFARLTAVDPGFDPHQVWTFELSLPGSTGPEQSAAYYEQALERLRAVPGVTDAGATMGLPLSGYSYGISLLTIDGRQLSDQEQEERPGVQVRVVTPGYFSTMGMTVRRGRGLEPSDRAGTAPVVVVSESAARSLFGDVDPLGHAFTIGTRLGLGRDRAHVGGTVVGVVNDVRGASLRREGRPTIYIAHQQFPVGSMVMTARTAVEPSSIAPAVAATLAGLDGNVPVFAERTMEDYVRGATATSRFYAVLIGTFGVLALVLAAVGVYGVLAQLVGERTREVGVRIALGASPSGVQWLVIRQGSLPIAAGLALGLLGAALASGLLATLLYDVTPLDPAVFALVAVLLAVVALGAAWVPARRAARVDPMVAIRSD